MLDICNTPDDITLVKYKTNTSVSLSSFSGKTILLSFINNGCGFCANWLKHMVDIYQNLPVPNEIELVVVFFNYTQTGVDANNKPIYEFLDATDELFDTELANLQIPNIPFTVLLDKGTPSSAEHYLFGFTTNVYLPFSYIISKNYKIVNKWHRQSTQSGEPLSFNSSDFDSTQNFVQHRLNTLQHVKEPWDTVLVLDYSDTMNYPVTLGGVTKKKVEFLQDAIEIFLNLWKDYAVCEDKAGVVFFRSETETDNSLLTILPGTNVQSIMTKIKTAAAHGCTAMGAGLATAIDMLQPGADKKFIVLFTDGMQNRNPLVYGTPPADMHIDNIGPANYPSPLSYLCQNGVSDGGQATYGGALPKALNTALNVAIHSIGIGIYGGWQDTLANISTATGGKFSAADTIWPNLVDYFVDSLIEFYRGSSLQLLKSEQQTLTGAERSEIFRLNRCAGKLTVLLDWIDPEHRLTFQLVKEGKEVNLRYKITEGQTYRIATIYFPHYQAASPGEDIEPEGLWELIIGRESPSDITPVAYHVGVLADDKIMEIIPEKHPNIWYTGDLIPLEFKVHKGKEPTSGMYTASATIIRPVTSSANLLYKYLGRSATNGQNMRLLANSQAIAESLAKREEEIISFQPKKVDEKNRVTHYGGTYERATVPGIYNVRLNVKGISARCGTFERVENKTFIVRAKPDPSASLIEGIYEHAGNRLSVSIVPMDKYGNIIGPGYSESLHYSHDGKRVGETIDNLDGSYRVDIPLAKRADLDKVNIVIKMADIVLFKGKSGMLIKKNLKK